MKISCEIIRDLLPLYKDGICSKESELLVEEHIAECEECSALLNDMNKEILPSSNIEENIKEAEVMKKISKIWRKDRLIALLEGIVFTMFILLILYCFLGIKIST